MPSNRAALAVSLIAVVVLLAACGTSTSSAAPTPTAARSPLPSLTGTVPPAGGQTDTEWGPIWDTLPGGFPSYPGSTPAEETATGPASANLVVEGVDAKAIATRFQGLLQGAGYSTVGLSGPLEDGSYVLDMTGSAAGCRLQISATPTGGLTTITILYGAACPHT